MPRVKVNPNVDTRGEQQAVRTAFVNAEEENQREELRDMARDVAREEAESGRSARSVDAVREFPRTRTDAANPRLSRPLPAAGTRRRMLSSRMKKDYSAKKNRWEGSLPKTRARAVERVLQSPDAIEALNGALQENLGMRSRLSPSIRRQVENTDRAIQDFERSNDREHLVYARMLAPEDTPESRLALRRQLSRMAREGGSGNAMTFDGYIPATHSLGDLDSGDDIVMEIQTRSGAYLGTSDSTPDADHIVGRGRRLQPVTVTKADYVKPDGSTGQRWVVQMRDVTDSVPENDE